MKKVAICFTGKYKNFNLTYQSYFDHLININKDIQFDIFFNSWDDDQIEIDNFKKKLNIKNIFVEKLDKKFINNMKFFGSLFPYLYKQSILIKVIKDISEYEFLFITRFDLRLNEIIKINKLENDYFYSFSGYTNKNYKKVIDWKNKVHKVKDFINIWKRDNINFNFFSHSGYVDPICDQGFIISSSSYKNYYNIFSLLEIWSRDYENTSSFRVRTQYVIEWFFNNPIYYISRYKLLFILYKFISKLFGFYFPFWVPQEKSIMSRHKPTIYSYHVNLNFKKKKVLNFDYTIIGK